MPLERAFSKERLESGEEMEGGAADPSVKSSEDTHDPRCILEPVMFFFPTVTMFHQLAQATSRTQT